MINELWGHIPDDELRAMCSGDAASLYRIRCGDSAHPGHSRNPGSVMYFAVESNDIAQLLGAEIPTEFDQEDRNDLATIRTG